MRRLQRVASTPPQIGLGAPLGQGLQQAGLADPGFAAQQHQMTGTAAHRAELLRSLPLLALFVCAWAAGETVGYAFGAGDALSRVK